MLRGEALAVCPLLNSIALPANSADRKDDAEACTAAGRVGTDRQPSVELPHQVGDHLHAQTSVVVRVHEERFGQALAGLAIGAGPRSQSSPDLNAAFILKMPVEK